MDPDLEVRGCRWGEELACLDVFFDLYSTHFKALLNQLRVVRKSKFVINEWELRGYLE
jgi:hypothetical protein